MTRATNGQRRAATELYVTWRRQGVPTLITSDEAWRLTHGRIGTRGDHSHPYGLAKLALLHVTTPAKYRMTLTPHPALALYGDQTVTEVWYLYAGEVTNRRRHTHAEGGRPWLPFELRPATR